MCSILCRSHRNRAKKAQNGLYFETNYNRDTTSGDIDIVKEAQSETFDSHVFGENILTLNKEESWNSSSSRSHEFVCINEHSGDLLNNYLIEMLQLQYIQLKTCLRKFQSKAHIMTHAEAELTKEITFTGFAKLNYFVASSIEYTIHAKKSTNVLQDQARRTDESDSILSNAKNSSLLHPIKGNIGSGACSAALKGVKQSSEHLSVGSTATSMAFSLQSGACKYSVTHRKHPFRLEEFCSPSSCDSANFLKRLLIENIF